MTYFITNVNAKLLCDAFVDSIDGGTAAGTIVIYGDAVPADADVALGAQTVLATLTFTDPAFGVAADAGPGAIATASAISDDTSADATDTATFFRIYNSTGTTIAQGSVGTSGEDLNLNTVAIQAGATVSITSMTVTMPES